MPSNKSFKKGLSLVEVLVGVSVFLIVSLGVYQGFVSIMNLVQFSKQRTLAMLAANEEIEVARNMPYDQVGIIQGIPSGLLARNKTVTKGGVNFSVLTSVRNIDDPFDGLIGGNPNDLAPADYKQIEIAVGCASCRNFSTTTVTGIVSPRNLESTGTNGALFVTVINSSGQPVPGASVHIENNQASPSVIIDETTNNDGVFQLVDIPPGAFAYEITVAKSGYSTAKTYPSDDPNNPNPVALHATVATGALTAISFTIDRLSTLNIKSIAENCSAVGGINFNLRGTKLIGTEPDIYKYEEDHITDGSGLKALADMEWDAYNFTLFSANYDLSGAIPLFPIILNPGTVLEQFIALKEKNPNALLVTVKDAATSLPVAEASVNLSGGGYDETLITNRGFITQSDWSGGAGQAVYADPKKYWTDISVDNGSAGEAPAGEIRLQKISGAYQPSGVLESSVFDAGSATTTYYTVSWLPLSQATSTGADSVKFQIATDNDSATSTWAYLGPDGAESSFYTTADSNINPIHSGNRYLRYKIYFSTEDISASPNISDISVTFSSDCVPYGQVLFSGAAAGTYALSVSRAGYQNYLNNAVAVNNPWQQLEVSISP